MKQFRVLLLIATMLVLMVGATAMAQDTAGSDAPALTGVTWQWVAVTDGESRRLVPTPDYTITFFEDGRFSARADCNRVLGTYTADDGAISLMPGPTTLVACPEGSLGGEFTRYLGAAVIYSFTRLGNLRLELPADSGTLLFRAQPQVTGSVSYRERMALPPGSVVRVQIQDVSIADAPTTILGEQVIITEGEQVPFSFAISYAASEIQENRRYSVAARITDPDGRLLFISDTANLVITDDRPTSDINLVLVRVSG
jgi:putative lipoprotein